MIDPLSIVIGMFSGILLIMIALMLSGIRHESKVMRIDDPTDDPDIQKVYDTPHCPDCGSYDLRLDSVTNGVPWLDQHTTEVDYYQCMRCARRFSDEEWQDAKSYAGGIPNGD